MTKKLLRTELPIACLPFFTERGVDERNACKSITNNVG